VAGKSGGAGTGKEEAQARKRRVFIYCIFVRVYCLLFIVRLTLIQERLWDSDGDNQRFTRDLPIRPELFGTCD